MPQTRRQELGKEERPVLVTQTDALNKAGHPTTTVVPGTSQVDAPHPGDHFPLRVRIQKTADLKHDTDLLIDQIRAILNARQLSGESHVESAHEPRTHVPTPRAAAGEHGVTNLLHGTAWHVAHAVTNRAKLRQAIALAPGPPWSDIGVASISRYDAERADSTTIKCCVVVYYKLYSVLSDITYHRS